MRLRAGPHDEPFLPARVDHAVDGGHFLARRPGLGRRQSVGPGQALVTAFTLPCAAEGAGVARAARAERMPAVIGFTLETDGRLPSGESLARAIREVDESTGAWPAYYMVNCAHPSHFEHVLDGSDWTQRIGAVRANASSKSHAELDAMDELDEGNPVEFGRECRALHARLPGLHVIGGCCGTDARHVAAVFDGFDA